jgi:phage baseplate assembly protein W
VSFDLKLFGGDLVIKNGDFETVEDSDKLVQDILKLVSTQLGSNPFFPAYGSPISQAMIGSVFEREFAEDIATQQLRASLERLQDLQRDQIRQNQIVTPSEQIAAIENVRVSQAQNDPRYYIVNLTVISKAFQRVPVQFAVTSV